MKHEGDKNRKIWVLLNSVPFSDVVALYGIAGVMLQFFSAPKQVNVTVGILGVLLLVLTIFVVIVGNNGGKRVKTSEAGIHKKDACVSKKTVHEGKKSISGVHRWVANLLCVAIIAFEIVEAAHSYSNRKDYFLRAEAGDAFAQVYIADYYNELGNEADSLYWYKVASEFNNKYAGIACNNLAFLYWQKYKASEDVQTYLPRIYELLKKATLIGNKAGEKNLCSFLYYFDFDFEHEENSKKKLLKLLVDDGILKDVSGFRQEVWEDAGTIIAEDALSSDEYTRYELKDISSSLSIEDKGEIVTYYTYKVKKSSLKPDRMELEYDSDINKHVQ